MYNILIDILQYMVVFGLGVLVGLIISLLKK